MCGDTMFYKISHGSVTIDGNTILEDINFQVTDLEKIGIVGRNGSGKTTLLRAICDEVSLSDGYDLLKIDKVGDYKIGYVKQNTFDNTEITFLDYILEVYKEIIDIKNKMNDILSLMESDYSDELLDKYNDLLGKYQIMGGDGYLKEYESMIKKFGFSSDDKYKKLRDFSGGELTRISLIKLLLKKPDLLILDEPTNHLDINTIEWLEEYLSNYKKSIIIVSHDRMFLDNICNVIYEIEYGTLKRYNGNYTKYVKQKEIDYLKQLKDYEAQQKEIERLKEIADRFRYKPTKASMAMSKLKQIERMKIIDKPMEENTKTFKNMLFVDKDSYRDVLKVKNLSIGYDKVLNTMSFNVYKGEKVGIIGDNGIGKSTLLKTIIGEIPPLGGKYVIGGNIKIGYFSQSFNDLNMENTIFEEMDYNFPKLTTNEIRTMLGSFMFSGDDVFKKIKDLSGGEKVRVSLCKIFNTHPNLLILDEPTNHLDIISKNTIEAMLKSYNGTIIMVSHDRYLIKNVCNKLLEFTKDGVNYFNYGYSEYLRKKENPVREELIQSVKKVNVREVNKNSRDNNITRRVKLIEKEIDSISLKIDNLNKELLREEVYTDYNKASEIKKEIDELNNQILTKTEEWDLLVNDI